MRRKRSATSVALHSSMLGEGIEAVFLLRVSHSDFAKLTEI